MNQTFNRSCPDLDVHKNVTCVLARVPYYVAGLARKTETMIKQSWCAEMPVNQCSDTE